MATFDDEARRQSGFEGTPDPTWTANLPCMKQERRGHAVVKIDEYGRGAMAIGGKDASGKFLESTEIYDSRTNEWVEGPNLNIGRSEFGAVFKEGKVIVAGGCSTQGRLNSIECIDFNSANPQFETLDVVLSCKRSSLAGVVHGSDVHFMGGIDESAFLTSVVDILNVTTGEIRRGLSLSTPREGFKAAVIGDTLHVAGGTDSKGNTLNTIESMKLGHEASGCWNKLKVAMSTARKYFSFAVIHHRFLVIMGGLGENNEGLKSTEIIDTKRGVCFKLPDMNAVRYAGGAVTLGDSSIILVGGSCDETSTYASMETLQLKLTPTEQVKVELLDAFKKEKMELYEMMSARIQSSESTVLARFQSLESTIQTLQSTILTLQSTIQSNLENVKPATVQLQLDLPVAQSTNKRKRGNA